MEFLKMWEILLRRKLIIFVIFLQFFIVTAVVTLVVKPSYEAKSLILVSPSDVVSTLRKALGLSDTSVSTTTTASEDQYDTEIKLATVKPLMKKLIARLNLKNKKGETMKPEDLTKGSIKKKIMPEPHVEIEQYEDSDILEITANSPSAEEAAKIANTFAELYIDSTLDRIREDSKSAHIYIESELSNVREEYYKVLVNVKDFMLKEKSINLSYQSQLLLDKIDNLKTSYEANENDISLIQKKQNEIQNQLSKINQFRKETEVFTENTRLAELKSRLNDLLINITVKTIDFQKEHPSYKQLEVEIDSVRKLILKETAVIFSNKQFSVDPIYDGLSSKLSESYIDHIVALAKRKLFQAYIDEYQKKLLKIPLTHIENDKLETELSSIRQAYTNFLDYRTRIAFGETLTLSNVRIVDPAEIPDKKNFPDTTINFILGIVFGLFLGICGAFFLEYIDYTIKNPDDFKRFKQLTLLGSIPKAKALKKKQTIFELDPTENMVEIIRTIRNDILSTSEAHPLKSISITSSIDSEGKSSFASNISIMFAKGGQNVILVELDFRKPSLHKYFKTSSDQGISNIFSGSNELDATIVQTGIEGLDLLLCGPIPADPSKLIESQNLYDIIKSLEHKYDVVIIDLPPVLPVNDGIVVSKITDGTVFVIEASRATFSMVEQAIHACEKAEVYLIGAVINKLKIGWTAYGGYTFTQYFMKLYMRMQKIISDHYNSNNRKHTKFTRYFMKLFMRINQNIIDRYLSNN